MRVILPIKLIDDEVSTIQGLNCSFHRYLDNMRGVLVPATAYDYLSGF